MLRKGLRTMKKGTLAGPGDSFIIEYPLISRIHTCVILPEETYTFKCNKLTGLLLDTNQSINMSSLCYVVHCGCPGRSHGHLHAC